MNCLNHFNLRHSSTAALALLAGTVCSARAAVLSWANPVGGTVSTAANWNPNQVPVPTDNLFFGLNQNMTITFNPAISQSSSMEWTGGNTATLRITGTIPAIPGTHTTGGARSRATPSRTPRSP